MRIRHLSAAVAAIAVFGLAACSTEQAGSAVTAGDAAAITAVPATDRSAPSTNPSAGGSADETTSDSTDESTSESADQSTSESAPEPAASKSSDTEVASSSQPAGPTSSPAEGSAPAAGAVKADVWPTEICKLMPADLVKGMQLEDGDPQLRCMYTGSVDGKYSSVIISKGSFNVTKDDPSGSSSGKNIKTSTVDGRRAWSWLTDNANSAWATFDSGEGSALLGIANEAKSPEENRKAVLALAEQISKALRSDKPMTGAASAPPTTTYPKVPAGTRAWPHVICDLMPEKMLSEMEKARGYESQSCRLSTDTKTGFSNFALHRTVPPTDLKDPSNGMGKDLKKESFDGRDAYSYLYGSGSVPTVYVLFSTGGRDWAEIRVSETDVVTPIKPEKVRADALELAKQIAPKLPKP